MSAAPDTRRAYDPPAIVADHVTVRYGDVLALDAATATINSARVCGLIGMNGSGKSTLFKALMGMVKLDTGTIELFGMTPKLARRRGLVAYVPQSEAVDWAFPTSVYDVAMMGRYGRQGPLRRPRAADKTAVTRALARVELESLADRQIGALSGGQRKRAFLARAIAQDAELLFLDEPFAGVDRRSESTIISLLHALRDEGRTIVIATHDLAGLPDLCDEAILLQQRVIVHGSPAEALAPEALAKAFGLESAHLPLTGR